MPDTLTRKPRSLQRTGRVVLSRVTIEVPQLTGGRHGIRRQQHALAYAPIMSSDPDMGGAAIVAVVGYREEDPKGEGDESGLPGLWPWAMHFNSTQNEQDLALWVVCRGWSSLIMRAPDTVVLDDVDWSADLTKSVVLNSPCYSHNRLGVGRLTLADDVHMKTALALRGPA